MNFANLLNNISQYGSEFVSSYCLINGAVMRLDEVQKMGYEEFSLRSKINMPTHLYRYYSDRTFTDEKTKKKVNYSIQALENNTVHLQSPTEFDDVYDSDVNIEYSEYERLRLAEYCHRCGLKVDDTLATQEVGNILVKRLWEHFSKNGNLESVFTKASDSEIEKLSNNLFSLSVLKAFVETKDFGKAVSVALQDEYNDYIFKLQTTFRTVCFATTPYSQLMWGGAYANCHKGFCIEYTVLPKEKEYEELYYNIFPMIYCKVRPEMSSRLAAIHDKEFSKDVLWDIYSHGVLRKSIDWAFQNEWRLVLPPHGKDFDVKFYPITRVFLGNRMSATRRKEIIDICHKKGIPYVGVKRKSSFFEMEPCEALCEDCPRYKMGQE